MPHILKMFELFRISEQGVAIIFKLFAFITYMTAAVISVIRNRHCRNPLKRSVESDHLLLCSTAVVCIKGRRLVEEPPCFPVHAVPKKGQLRGSESVNTAF